MLSTIGRAAVRRVVAGSQQSTNRAFSIVFRLRRVQTSQDSSQSPIPTSQFHARRCYATTTATKAKAAPKKPAAKKAAAKPKAKTATKVVKKPVKKVAKKVPAKKLLTEEQKAALLKKKAREAFKELKAKALLSPPKKKPSTLWQVILAEGIVKGPRAGGGSGFADETPKLAEKMRNLTPAEIESYNHIANQNKAQNEVEYKKWVASHTPDEIRIANKARQQLAKETKQPRKYQMIKDSRLPVGPSTERALFTRDRHASGDFKGLPIGECAKLISKDWEALSAAEKQAYTDRALASRQRYYAEYKTVYHRDNPRAAQASV